MRGRDRVAALLPFFIGVPFAFALTTAVTGVGKVEGCSGAAPYDEPVWVGLMPRWYRRAFVNQRR